MADEVQWREGDEDGKQVAEVNGWTVTVKPTPGDSSGEWFCRADAQCPTCGNREHMGATFRRTVTAAQAAGIELARQWRPKCARAMPRTEDDGHAD